MCLPLVLSSASSFIGRWWLTAAAVMAAAAGLIEIHEIPPGERGSNKVPSGIALIALRTQNTPGESSIYTHLVHKQDPVRLCTSEHRLRLSSELRAKAPRPPTLNALSCGSSRFSSLAISNTANANILKLEAWGVRIHKTNIANKPPRPLLFSKKKHAHTQPTNKGSETRKNEQIFKAHGEIELGLVKQSPSSICPSCAPRAPRRNRVCLHYV